MSLAAGGMDHSACVDAAGNIWTVGSNRFGQLGHGNTESITNFKKIECLKEIKAASCTFYHTACLDKNGSLWAFGIGVYGHIGNGSTQQHSTPQKVCFSPNVVIESFTCGYNHTVCIDTDGKCWGFGSNDHGQIGLDSTAKNILSPQMITLLNDPIFSVASKSAFTLFLDYEGNVKAAGSNTSGQFGIEKGTYLAPQAITTVNNIVAISAGYQFSLFLNSKNEVYSCGENDNGQLGHGNQISCSSYPQKIETLPPIITISTGYKYSLFIDDERTLWGCGCNENGELGLGDCEKNRYKVFEPIKLPVSDVETVSQSTHHTIIKQYDGEVLVFGKNDSSQLGIVGEGNKKIANPTVLENYSHVVASSYSRAKGRRK